MKPVCLFVLFTILCFSGCSTPGSKYARAHPELSPAHREILISGQVPGGLAVEGMTKEQIRLAIGDPARLDTLNGQSVWVYVRQRFLDISPGNDPGSKFGSGPSTQQNFTENTNLGPRPSVKEVTTIFFKGDRAVRAQLSRE
jgi:outer membrane protein assembly factor BamE (lipoprotein component of BamABCDE complex)